MTDAPSDLSDLEAALMLCCPTTMYDSIAGLLAKARDRDEARALLGVYRDAREISAMSWNGFTIIGDRASIKEVERVAHRSEQLDEYQHGFENRMAALKAERDKETKRADFVQALLDAATKEVKGLIGERDEARRERDIFQLDRAALYDKLNGTPCAEIRWQQERDALRKALEGAEKELEKAEKLTGKNGPWLESIRIAIAKVRAAIRKALTP